MKVRAHKKLGRYIRRFFRRKVLSRYGKGILADTKNGYLVVDPGDFGVARSLLEKGEYDSSHIQWLKKIVGDSSELIIFIGAHIGSLLVPLSSSAKMIFGYEADPENFEMLRMNIALNNIQNACIYNKAIGEKAGSAIVIHNSLNTGNSSISEGGDNGEGVEVVPLDAELDTFPFQQIDLLVMDIEGHELHALKGSTNLLDKLSILDIEFAPEQLADHGSDPVEMLDLIFDHFGYMYILREKPHKYNKESAMIYLREKMDQKGFLINLIFSKKELSIPEE